MKLVAVVRIGDARLLRSYWTHDGYHRFLLDGEEVLVRENAAVKAEVWTDLGDLVDLDGVPRLLQKRIEMAYAHVAREGMTVRYFEQVESGFLEVPVGNITHAWSAFRAEVHSRSVTYTPQGQPALNLESVKSLEQDLRNLGFTQPRAAAIIDASFAAENVGHAQSFLRNHVLRYLLPTKEDPMAMLPWMLYAAYVGLELGSNPAISSWYTSVDRSYVILTLTGIAAAYYLWRRWRR